MSQIDSVKDAVERLRKAMVNADEEALRRLTAEALSYGHTSGLIESREEFIRAIVGENRRDVFEDIQLLDQIVSLSGDVAIVRHRFQARVLVNSTPMTPDIRVLQVWQLQEGEWKLLARQAYRI